HGGVARGASYGELDMDQLRRQAPLMRQPVGSPSRGDQEELLRTLGQELDVQNVRGVDVKVRDGFYEVRGSSDEGPVYRFYSVSELRALSERRRGLRGT